MSNGNNSRRIFLRTTAASLIAPEITLAAREKNTLDLCLVIGESGDFTSEILKTFTEYFPDTRIIRSDKINEHSNSGLVYVALGAAALQSLIDVKVPAPILSLFISNEAYTRIISSSPSGAVLFSAIYAEAHPLHQLKLLRVLYKHRIAVLALFSSGTVHLQPVVEQAARANDLELQARIVDTDEHLVRALLSQRDAKAVLMMPDRALYTVDNIRYFLEAAYRNQRGVAGFSPSLVRAGALACAYSSISDVVSQVRPIAERLASGHDVSPQYSSYWRVLINERIANSLDIVVSDSDRRLGRAP